ncbi:MAG: hypothetical protein QNJ49_17650 [Mastigocoleus sp. MO_167.B18]|nr:hypothetical protein [Mastigocoleus sp. MO_167.B18]
MQIVNPHPYYVLRHAITVVALGVTPNSHMPFAAGVSPIPNRQSPIANLQSPITNPQ